MDEQRMRAPKGNPWFASGRHERIEGKNPVPLSRPCFGENHRRVLGHARRRGEEFSTRRCGDITFTLQHLLQSKHAKFQYT